MQWNGGQRNGGVIGGLFKLIVFGAIILVALSVFYPQVLEDPSIAMDGIEMLHRAAETGTAVNVSKIDVTEVERQIHRDVNTVRTQQGLEPFSYDTELAAIARTYSQDMAERDFFSHYSPEGEDFADRYEDAGYDCEIRANDQIYSGGENLAKNAIGRPVEDGSRRDVYTSIDDLSQAVVTGWINSPDHRKNLLHEVWQRHGIGVHITDSGAVYVTQNFC